MPGATPINAIPYPLEGDAGDPALWLYNQATALDPLVNLVPQSGRTTVSFAGTFAATTSVVFATPYATAPTILLTVQNAGNFDLVADISVRSTTGFSARLAQAAGTAITGSATLHWVAYG